MKYRTEMLVDIEGASSRRVMHYIMKMELQMWRRVARLGRFHGRRVQLEWSPIRNDPERFRLTAWCLPESESSA